METAETLETAEAFTKGTVGDGTLGTSRGHYFEHSVFVVVYYFHVMDSILSVMACAAL